MTLIERMLVKVVFLIVFKLGGDYCIMLSKWLGVLWILLPVICFAVDSEWQEIFKSSDKACDGEVFTKGHVIYNFNINKYTGVRVFKVYKVTTLPFSVVEFVKFVYCQDGKKKYEQNELLNDDDSTDIYWYKPFSFKVKEKEITFKLSRKPNYIERDSNFLLPGFIVGGLFHCYDSYCRSDNSEPVLPLYSDTYRKLWIEVQHGSSMSNWTFEKYLPLVSTPNDNNNQVKQLKPIIQGKEVRSSSMDVIIKIFKNGEKYKIDNNDFETDKWYNGIDIEENYIKLKTKTILNNSQAEKSINKIDTTGNTVHSPARAKAKAKERNN